MSNRELEPGIIVLHGSDKFVVDVEFGAPIKTFRRKLEQKVVAERLSVEMKNAVFFVETDEHMYLIPVSSTLNRYVVFVNKLLISVSYCGNVLMHELDLHEKDWKLSFFKIIDEAVNVLNQRMCGRKTICSTDAVILRVMNTGKRLDLTQEDKLPACLSNSINIELPEPKMITVTIPTGERMELDVYDNGTMNFASLTAQIIRRVIEKLVSIPHVTKLTSDSLKKQLNFFQVACEEDGKYKVTFKDPKVIARKYRVVNEKNEVMAEGSIILKGKVTQDKIRDALQSYVWYVDAKTNIKYEMIDEEIEVRMPSQANSGLWCKFNFSGDVVHIYMSKTYMRPDDIVKFAKIYAERVYGYTDELFASQNGSNPEYYISGQYESDDLRRNLNMVVYVKFTNEVHKVRCNDSEIIRNVVSRYCEEKGIGSCDDYDLSYNIHNANGRFSGLYNIMKDVDSSEINPIIGKKKSSPVHVTLRYSIHHDLNEECEMKGNKYLVDVRRECWIKIKDRYPEIKFTEYGLLLVPEMESCNNRLDTIEDIGSPEVVINVEEPENDEIAVTFKLDENQFSHTFTSENTIADAKKYIAEERNCKVEDVTLLFAGKALRDKLKLTRLRLNAKSVIMVYVNDTAEVLIASAKSLLVTKHKYKVAYEDDIYELTLDVEATVESAKAELAKALEVEKDQIVLWLDDNDLDDEAVMETIGIREDQVIECTLTTMDWLTRSMKLRQSIKLSDGEMMDMCEELTPNELDQVKRILSEYGLLTDNDRIGSHKDEEGVEIEMIHEFIRCGKNFDRFIQKIGDLKG